jgi:hypothetical protein
MPGQRVRDTAQQALVLDLLPVSLPLGLPGLFLRLAGPLLLCCLLFGGCLPLLRPAFLFLGLVAGQGAPGFFCLAFGLVVHSYSFLSTALQRSQLLDTPFSPGTLHLGEVHTHLLSFLLSRLRGVRLLLASAALGLAFALLASFFLLFISATAAGEPAGQTAHGVLSLLGRSSGDLRRLSRNLSCLVGHLPDLIRDSVQRSSAVLAFSLLVVDNYSFPSTAI